MGLRTLCYKNIADEREVQIVHFYVGNRPGCVADSFCHVSLLLYANICFLVLLDVNLHTSRL